MAIRFARIQGRGGSIQQRMQDIQQRMRAPFSGPIGPQAVGYLRTGAKEQFEKKAYITLRARVAWAKRMARKGRSAGRWPLLNKTGRLKRDWTAGTTQKIEPRRVSVTVTTPYAGFHQRGTRRMVARPIGITPNAYKQIAKAVREYLLGKSQAGRAAA